VAFGPVEAVGVAAALCSMTSFAPQILKLARTRDASGVSLRTYAVTVTGFALWIVYGVLLGSWPVAVSNSVCLAMSGAVLALKWRYSR
jgi:MtN3 and saliva related transmembrane protein